MKEAEIIETLDSLRLSCSTLENSIDFLNSDMYRSRELSLAFTHCQNAKMWLGLVKREYGGKFPYVADKDRKTTKDIKPTAEQSTDTFVYNGNKRTADEDVKYISAIRVELDRLTKIYLNLVANLPTEGKDMFIINSTCSEAYRQLKHTKNWLGMQFRNLQK